MPKGRSPTQRARCTPESRAKRGRGEDGARTASVSAGDRGARRSTIVFVLAPWIGRPRIGERPELTSSDGPAVAQELVQGEGEGGVVAVDDHAGGVPDEDDVRARGVDLPGGRVVVSGDDRDLVAPPVLLHERSRRDPPRAVALRARPRAVDGALVELGPLGPAVVWGGRRRRR